MNLFFLFFFCLLGLLNAAAPIPALDCKVSDLGGNFWVWIIPDYCKSVSTARREMLISGDLDILVAAILAVDPKTTALRSLYLDENLTAIPTNLATALTISKARGVPIALTTRFLNADASAELLDAFQVKDLEQKRTIASRIQQHILAHDDEECPVEGWSIVLQAAANKYLSASPEVLLQNFQLNTLKSFADEENSLYAEKKRLAQSRKEEKALRELFPKVCACLDNCQKRMAEKGDDATPIAMLPAGSPDLLQSDPEKRYDPNFRAALQASMWTAILHLTLGVESVGDLAHLENWMLQKAMVDAKLMSVGNAVSYAISSANSTATSDFLTETLRSPIAGVKLFECLRSKGGE